MKNLIAVIAFVAAANAFAGEPTQQQQQQAQKKDGMLIVRTAKQMGNDFARAGAESAQAVVDAGKWSVDQLAQGLTECTIKYKKKGAVLVIGATVGNADMTCTNDVSGKQNSKLDTVEIMAGAAAGAFSEEGEIRLAGYGTSAKQVAGILAHARYIRAFGEGISRGVAVGAFVGPTGNIPVGATSVFGYSRGKVNGVVLGATVSVEILLDSAVREGIVGDDQNQQQQQQQSNPGQQSKVQQAKPVVQSKVQQANPAAQQNPAQQK